jgi:hypothetical protein
MRYRSLLVTLLTLMMVAALASVALAGKPEHTGKPTTTTPTAVTPTTVPGYWTCQARNDNGAVWPLGTYDQHADIYTGEGPALCVDIVTEHLDVTSWLVEWSGTTAKGTVKGLKLVFEEEVHGTVYDETVVYVESDDWRASWSQDVDVQNLVFVAMPHSGDKWDESMTFTITPSGDHNR